MKIAAAYASLVNGGYYLKPTIVAGTFDRTTNQYHENAKTVIRQIFRPDTAEALKNALFDVINTNGGLEKLV